MKITHALLLAALAAAPALAADPSYVKSVEDWRVAHESFFGRSLSPETLIVATRFRVVERV